MIQINNKPFAKIVLFIVGKKDKNSFESLLHQTIDKATRSYVCIDKDSIKELILEIKNIETGHKDKKTESLSLAIKDTFSEFEIDSLSFFNLIEKEL